MKKLTTAILSLCLVSAAVTPSFMNSDLSFARSVKGDINGDGAVNAADFLSWLKYFHGTDKDSEASLFDINEDGKINIIDYISFKNTLVNPAANPDSDFEIKDGVLVKYNGKDKVVKIPDSVTSIAERAFWSNDDIVAVYIPGTVKSVGNSAFWSCSALEYLDIAEGVESIGETLTWSCPSLKDVNLPSTIKLSASEKEMPICDKFDNCPVIRLHLSPEAEGKDTDSEWIATHTLIRSDGWAPVKYDFTPVKYEPSESGPIIAPAAYISGKFEEFIIPEGTESIGARAFDGCKNLKSITIPGSVKTIGSDAFHHCDSLAEVYICEGCETINYRAFGYCNALTDLTLPASLTAINKGAFEYCPSVVIHCPKDSYAEKFAKENKLKYDNVVNAIELPQTEPENTTISPLVTDAPVTTTAEVTDAPVTTAQPESTTTAPVTTVQAVTTTAVVSEAKPFDINNASAFTVTSKNLNGGVWDDVISNTERGSNASPELSWAAAEGASSYAIYMIDTSAGNWMHWKSANVTSTSLKQGWAKRNEYVGPYPPSGTHTYEIYVFALKESVSSMQGNFDDENAGIETLAKSLDKTSAGTVGNIISYGHISGTFSH